MQLPYRVVASSREYCRDPAQLLFVPMIMVEFHGDNGCGIEVPLGYGLIIIAHHSCGTTGCDTAAYIMVGNEQLEALKPLVVAALRRLWAEYVKEVEMRWWDGWIVEVIKWRREPEDELENDCGDARIKVRLPLRRLREILREVLGERMDELERLLEEARRQIEELERRIEESRESGELSIEAAEQLESHAKRLKESLMLNVGDELEVE